MATESSKKRRRRQEAAPWYINDPDKQGRYSTVVYYYCRDKHEIRKWVDRYKIRAWYTCPKCGGVAMLKELAERIRTTVDTTGRINDASFGHFNGGLVPINPRQKAHWRKMGLLTTDPKTGLPAAKVESREMYHWMLKELRVGTAADPNHHGTHEEQLRLDKYPLGKRPQMPYDDPRQGIGPSMARRLATDPAFRKRWENRSRHIEV